MRSISFIKLTPYYLLSFFSLVVFNTMHGQSAAGRDSGILKQIEINVTDEPKPVIENKIKDAFIPVPFQNQVLQGYIGTRYTQNLEERLLKIDENGIMSGYLHRPGNHPWIGEHVGKYLEAACNVWRNTHDTALKKQMDRMMYELIHSQLKNGYLGTYMPDNYWTSWDVWSHKYKFVWLTGLLYYNRLPARIGSL